MSGAISRWFSPKERAFSNGLFAAVGGTVGEGTSTVILPALVAISAALSVMFNLRVFWRWAGKQRLSYPLFGDLLRWSAPEWLIWGLIASGFGMLAPIAAVRDIAVNAFLCFAVVYLCQGLAIMAFYFQALAVPGVVRAIIYFVVLGYPFVAAVGYPFAASGYFVVPE